LISQMCIAEVLSARYFPFGDQATAHDEAHNAFMTLPPYTRIREGEAPPGA
jgi:hypothetical protein